jgi:hypothetical protein
MMVLFCVPARPNPAVQRNRSANRAFRPFETDPEALMTIKGTKHKLHEKDHAAKHESDFRVTARRNKLFGLWLAEMMGLPAGEHEAYAKKVVSADLEEPGDEDVLRKVEADLQERNVTISREELVRKLNTLSAEARVQLQAG